MRRTPRGTALHILFFLSGAAALGYQLVWAKMFSTGLGHEMPAMLAIICAFMAGMALGAAFIDRFIPRDRRAGLWFCGLELTIGIWAIAASFAVPSVNDVALRLMGLAPTTAKHWLIAFAIPALVLLPATAAMGATFPAMEKFLSAFGSGHSSIGGIYGANTLGAVAGTLLAPFVLMPALGFAKSCWVLALVNAVAGIGAWLAFRFVSDGERDLTSPSARKVQQAQQGKESRTISPSRIRATLFVTGLLGIAYETAGVRVLTQVMEGTVYTYAAVLAIFLLGTAVGAVSYHRWWRGREATQLLTRFLCITSAACLSSVVIMTQSPVIYRFARGLGDSASAVLAAELITALAVFALPTVLMGALFSHLVQLMRTQHGEIGRVVAANTLGAALGPVLSVVILLPLIGCKLALVLIGAGYLALIIKLPKSRLAWAAIIAVGIALSADLRIVDVPSGGRIISYQEGVMASVAVLSDTNDQRTLRVDNRFQMGGTAAADAEYRQAHLPLLLHPTPRRALFLGVGTGISFGAASLYPHLQADGVELVPEVVESMNFFASKNFSPNPQSNLTLHIADARRFVRTTDEHYDVIIADLFHPYRDGAGALYTSEHFGAIRQRLATNGIFCQWLPLHQLDVPTLRVIVRTFHKEFRNTEAWLLRFNVDVPVLALIGRRNTASWQTNIVESRLDEALLAGELKRLALADSLRLYGHWLAGSEELSVFADRAPLNTDDHPRVTFMAPTQAYLRQPKPYASLQPLLSVSDESIKSARDKTDSNRQGEFEIRLSRYLAARNVYLRGLIHDSEQRRDEAIDAFVESARLSAEFTSGYAQCLTIANVIAPSDPARAKRILERLVEAQPDRPVAKQMLERLFPR